MSLAPQTTTHHTTVEPPFPGAPAFTFHLTRLSDTLFVWIGAAERAEDDVKRTLAQEWAVAMPSRGVRQLTSILSELITEHSRHSNPRIQAGLW